MSERITTRIGDPELRERLRQLAASGHENGEVEAVEERPAEPPAGEAEAEAAVVPLRPGVVPVTDEDPEPDDDEDDAWPEAVDGAELLGELVAYFNGALLLPEGGADVLALYAAVTWLVDLLSLVPYLNVTSPTKGSGKSSAGELASHVVRQPRRTANATGAWIFRQTGHPTLIIDEGDTFLNLSEDLRGILDAGYQRGLTVGRVESRGRQFVPVQYDPFGPKVVCGIGSLPDTVLDRCLVVDMRRKKRSEQRDRFNRRGRREYADRGAVLRRKLARWVRDSWGALDKCEPELPHELSDREQDNWEPLFMVAQVAGGPWPDRVREVALLLEGQRGAEDELTRLLRDVYDLLVENRPYTANTKPDGTGEVVTVPGWALTPTELQRRLCLLEERPWRRYGQRESGISTDKLGKLLGSAGIRSQVERVAGVPKPLRVYLPGAFNDAWERYEVTPPTT